MPPKKQFPCIVCKQNVTDRDPKGSINCNVCQRWTHAPCANLDSKMLGWFKDMQDKTGKHCYSCEGCALGYHQMDIKIAQLDRRLREVEERGVEAQAEAAQTKVRVGKVEEEITEVRSTLKACKGEAVKESTKAWSMELRERKAREMNIILYGLAELPSSNTRGEDRKQHDTTEYTNMLTEIGCEVSMEDVKFLVRVGDMRDDVATNPRPLKVGLKSLSTREDIFSKARRLPQCSYSEVSIAPDLTKLQREEEKELADEAARLTDEQSESDFLAYEFRCVGRKGERVIRRVRKQDQGGQARGRGAHRGRGRGQGRGQSRGRGRHSSQSVNLIPLGERQSTPDNNTTDKEADEESANPSKWKRSDWSVTISPSSPGFSGTTKKQRRAAAQAAAQEAEEI